MTLMCEPHRVLLNAVDLNVFLHSDTPGKKIKISDPAVKTVNKVSASSIMYVGSLMIF